MKIGSLCSGYGGLDMATEAYFGAKTVWMSDIDKAAAKVIAERWQMPNLGDLKEVNWEDVEPVDILTAGYPCQPFSNAGLRKGANDSRHLWPTIKDIIGKLQPRIVILENVRGHLTLGFKEVLQDLAQIGYDAKWSIVRASDVGAPHRRERLFVIAQPSNPDSNRSEFRGQTKERNQGQSQSEFGKCSSPSANTHNSRGVRNTQEPQGGFDSLAATNPNWDEQQGNRRTQELGRRYNTQHQMRLQRTPNPLDLNNKLNPVFVEYMMGLPEGWVTGLDISRSQQLKLLGNGVVPQQAEKAIDILMNLK